VAGRSANANANADYQGTITIPAGTTGNASLRFFQGVTTANSFKISGSLAGTGDLAVNAPAAATLTLSGNNTGFTGRVIVNANAIVSPISLASYPANGITLNGGTLRNATLNTVSPIIAGLPGLTASYYSFGNNPGIASNQFATDLLLGEARVVSRVDSQINILNNGLGTFPVIGIPGFSFNTNHGVMWKGLLNITDSGSYQFSGINDDNAVLYIDGVQIGTLGVTGNTNTNIGAAINLTAQFRFPRASLSSPAPSPALR